MMSPLRSKPPKIKPTEEINDILKDASFSFAKVNKIARRKGYCHGRCLTLLQMVQENPDSNIEDWYKASSERVAYFQTLEILRGYFDRLSKKDQTGAKQKLQRVLQLMPEISEFIPPFSFERKRFLSLFKTEKSCTIIVRCWNRKKAHSFLIYRSKKNPCFYDSSRKRGLYLCEDIDRLGRQFLSYLKGAYPGFVKRKSWCCVEKYCSFYM